MGAGTIFITLICVPWFDLIVLTVSALDFQRMSNSMTATPPRWAKPVRVG